MSWVGWFEKGGGACVVTQEFWQKEGGERGGGRSTYGEEEVFIWDRQEEDLLNMEGKGIKEWNDFNPLYKS